MRKLVKRYIAERDNSAEYSNQLRQRIDRLCEFVGGNPRPGDCTERLINAWLEEVGKRVSKITLDSYRANILTLLRYAAMLELCNEPRPHRIKKPKIVLPMPKALTRPDVERLIASAGNLKGPLRQRRC